MDLPGRPIRIGVFAVCAAGALGMFIEGHPRGGVLLIPAVVLVVPEIMGSWRWFVDLCKAHVFHTEDNERFYLYRLTDIRARDEGPMIWFLARHIGDALEMKNLDAALGSVEAAHKKRVGRDLFVSEIGVGKLIEVSRNAEAGKFKLFFEREIMFPIKKKRDFDKSQ